MWRIDQAQAIQTNDPGARDGRICIGDPRIGRFAHEPPRPVR
ncbi:hypothetical protein D779_2071 [Imhoffiella purpurea]|uniref:Uncharacterized protein n=1 Tax=Imhoffiella purpurea TaxID=1249627 RepID=W9VWT3_9GAMM|nr:hypothetical protein D779_2071 [Imhoffiella purpurea]